MTSVARHDLEAAIRQCGSTALIIHDLLGGELLIAEVVQEPRIARRPAVLPTRGARQYLTLKHRVLIALGIPEADGL